MEPVVLTSQGGLAQARSQLGCTNYVPVTARTVVSSLMVSRSSRLSLVCVCLRLSTRGVLCSSSKCRWCGLCVSVSECVCVRVCLLVCTRGWLFVVFAC
jgi:hypothetical protein